MQRRSFTQGKARPGWIGSQPEQQFARQGTQTGTDFHQRFAALWMDRRNNACNHGAVIGNAG